MKGQAAQTKAMKSAERARERQMALESARRRREIIRNQIVANSQATYNAYAQGAGEGSGLQGGLAQVSGDSGNQQVAVNQNQQLGSQIFAANQKYYDASGMANFGAGLSSLGGALINNAGTIGRLSTFGTGRVTQQ